jgi:hypothetical protein
MSFVLQCVILKHLLLVSLLFPLSSLSLPSLPLSPLSSPLFSSLSSLPFSKSYLIRKKELRNMHEREIAATKEIKGYKEQEATYRKEMMRLRAEIDALRAQVTRADLVTPDAHELHVELASVRASIYDAKSKNESLINGMQTFYIGSSVFIFL